MLKHYHTLSAMDPVATRPPHPLQKLYGLLWEGCEAFKLASTYVRDPGLKQEFGAIGKSARHCQDQVQILLRRAERTPRVILAELDLFARVQQRDRPLNDKKKDSQMVVAAFQAIERLRVRFQELCAELAEIEKPSPKLAALETDLDRHLGKLSAFQKDLELDPDYPLPESAQEAP